MYCPCLIRLAATSLAADLALDAVDYTQRLRRRRPLLLIRLPPLPRRMAKTPTNIRPASIEAPRKRQSSQARLHKHTTTVSRPPEHATALRLERA